MANPITLVKLLVKEADSNESCIKCGGRRAGLPSLVFYIYYIDPHTGESMITGWSFPLCPEHISEEILKYPADKEILTKDCLSDLENETRTSRIKPPPISPFFIPHAD